MHSESESFDVKLVTSLAQLGYLPESARDEPESANELVGTAISAFQEFCGLPITGTMDEQTENAMNRPRCGNPFGYVGIGLEFVLSGTTWPGARVTFGFDNFSTDIAQNLQRQLILNAFAVWEGLMPMRFTEIPIAGNPDIRIQWATATHGPAAHDAFDGAGNVLAHAFFPPPNGTMAGDVHFDDDEQWTDSTTVGTNLFWVAVHEIGHALGLDHTSIPNSIMQPFYPCNRGIPNNDDRLGIRTAYRELVWIDFLYRDILGRAPDIDGLDRFCRSRNGGSSTGNIVDGFLRSAEYCTQTAASLYRILLNREPDAAGLDHWKNILMRGASLQSVIVGLCDSQEFKAKFPVPGRFVEVLYNKLLGRPSDSSGYTGWVNAINAGMSTANVIRGFLTAEEYAVKRVTEFYRTFLRRAPDQTGSRVHIAAVRRGVAMQEVIRGFVASDEYRNAVISR